jgi:hypothetical protein
LDLPISDLRGISLGRLFRVCQSVWGARQGLQVPDVEGEREGSPLYFQITERWGECQALNVISTNVYAGPRARYGGRRQFCLLIYFSQNYPRHRETPPPSFWEMLPIRSGEIRIAAHGVRWRGHVCQADDTPRDSPAQAIFRKY